MLDEENNEELKLKYPYFLKEPLHFKDESPDYTNSDYISASESYEWMWSISDIINSLIDEGITIQYFKEYNTTVFKMFPFLENDGNGCWKLPKEMDKIPLMFSLKGIKRVV